MTLRLSENQVNTARAYMYLSFSSMKRRGISLLPPPPDGILVHHRYGCPQHFVTWVKRGTITPDSPEPKPLIPEVNGLTISPPDRPKF